MFAQLADMKPGSTIETDLCVIGGGAAGISLARALAGSRIDVLLLEAGGWEIDSATQSLYRGESVGLLPPSNLEACRLRYFGGTTNHWGGWCAPLVHSDFTPRGWVADSGWPIDRGDLDPYYVLAQEVCGLGRFDYEPSTWMDASEDLPSLHPSKLTTRLWQIVNPPPRFGALYRDELARAANVRVLLGANVTNLETTHDGGLATMAHVRTLEGHSYSVSARKFVVACGAIENARLLLLSNTVERAGIGNRRDLVGRYFMQHPHISTAAIDAADPIRLAAAFRRRDQPDIGLRPCVCPTLAAQARNRILNCSMTIEHDVDDDSGYVALRRIGRALREGELPDSFGDRVLDVLTDLEGASDAAADVARDVYEPPVTGMSVYVRCEQAPNASSRIQLGDRRDALGLQQVKMDWRLTAMEKQTIRITNGLLAEELGRLGLGRLRMADWLEGDDEPWPDTLHTGCHHMGTTRMADDPSRGVVDSNARVHGVANLYIAGSSIFPTSGWANPTLTLVALALRLADHLRAEA